MCILKKFLNILNYNNVQDRWKINNKFERSFNTVPFMEMEDILF